MDLNKASYQKIFNKVVNHLRTQGVQALAPTGSCYYKVPHSKLKCAVGCLIPSNKYNRSIEGSAVNQRPVYSMLGLKSVSKKIAFLREIQNIHDENTPDKWEELFAKFAKKYKLKLKKL